MPKQYQKNHPRRAIATGHIAGSLELELEQIAEPISILEEGTKFCEYAGTKYPCCQRKVCFENSPCKVRDYRNKYNL